jgi:predicted nucleic acid-binding protein
MDSSQLGVILDSSVIIEAERQHLDVAGFLRHIASQIGDREAAICSVTVAELAHGIHRADNLERRQRRRQFLDDLKAALLVCPITAETAEVAGRIGAECAARGVIVPFGDLLIGACALERRNAILTRNARHFRMLPGLELLSA